MHRKIRSDRKFTHDRKVSYYALNFTQDENSSEGQVRIIESVMRLPTKKKNSIFRKKFKTRPQIKLSTKLILENPSIFEHKTLKTKRKFK